MAEKDKPKNNPSDTGSDTKSSANLANSNTDAIPANPTDVATSVNDTNNTQNTSTVNDLVHEDGSLNQLTDDTVTSTKKKKIINAEDDFNRTTIKEPEATTDEQQADTANDSSPIANEQQVNEAEQVILFKNKINESVLAQQNFINISQKNIEISYIEVASAGVEQILNTAPILSVSHLVLLNPIITFTTPKHENIAPTISLSTNIQFINQTADLVFNKANENLITVADADDYGNTEVITITVNSGILTLHNITNTGISVEGNNSSKIIFTGTLTALNQALDGLSLKSNANFSGKIDLNISINDQGHSGNTANDLGTPRFSSSNIAIMSNASSVDFASQNINLNNQHPFVLSGSNSILVTDTSNPLSPPSVYVKLIAANGTIHFSGSNSYPVIYGDSASIILLQDSISNINNDLQQLIFTPYSNFSGATNIRVVVSDLADYLSIMNEEYNHAIFSKTLYLNVNSSTISLVSPNDTVNINYNIPGSNNVNSINIFGLNNGNLIQVGDLGVSSAAIIKIQLSTSEGVLGFSGNVAGFGISYGADNVSSGPNNIVTITDTLSNINDALQLLNFTANSGFNGSANIKILSNDLPNVPINDPASASYIKNLIINVNDATVSIAAPNQSVNIDYNIAGSNNSNIINVFGLTNNIITIGDVGDDGSTNIITVKLTTQHGTLGCNQSIPSTATVTAGSDNTIIIIDTLNNINNFLQQVTFTPTLGFNGTTNITIVTNNLPNILTLTDSSDPSNYTRTLSVNVNDATISLLPVGYSINIGAHDTPEINLINPYQLIDSSGNNLIQVGDVGNNGSTDQVTIQLTTQNGTLGFSSTIPNANITAGANNTITLYDTLNNVNNALKLLTFTPSDGFNGTTQITVITNNLPGVLTATNNSDPSNYIRTLIVNVNDATVSVIPGDNNININSNIELTGSSHQVNIFALKDSLNADDLRNGLIQIRDLSNATYPAGIETTVQLTVQDGTLGFGGSSLPTIAANGTTISGNTVVTMVGTVDQVNAALSLLTFTANAGFNGVAKINVLANNAAVAITDASSYVQHLNINVNDAVVTMTPNNSININANILTGDINVLNTFALIGSNLIQVADPVALGDVSVDPITVQLTANHGRIDFSSQVASATVTNGLNNTITISGMVDDVNNALKLLIFTPDIGFSGSATVDVLSNNLSNTSITDLSSYHQTLTINVNNAIIDLLSPNINMISILPSITLSGANAIQIIDASTADNITVQLSVNNGRITLTDNNSPAVITSGYNNAITITDTVSNINTYLEGLIFTITPGFVGAASISVLANDLVSGSNINGVTISDPSSYLKTLHINMSQVNDATAIIPQPENTNLLVNTYLVLSGSNAIQISNNRVGGDENTINTVKLTAIDGIITLSSSFIDQATIIDGANNSSTITIVDTLGHINANLNGLIFTPTHNFLGAANIQVIASNSPSGLLDAYIDTKEIPLNVAYVPPVITNLNQFADNYYIENTNADPTSPVYISNSIVLKSDELDFAGDYGGSSFKIFRPGTNGLPNPQDIFSFGDTSLINVVVAGTNSGTLSYNNNIIANFNTSSGQITIDFVNNGTAISKTLLNQIVHTIQYSNASSDPPTSINLKYIFNDGWDHVSDIIVDATTTLNITQVNNAPFNIVPVETQSFSSQNTLVFSDFNNNKISIGDIDAGDKLESITLEVSHGTLQLNSIAGLTNVSGQNTNTIIATGTIKDLNDALNGLKFTPDLNYYNSDILKITTNDQGNTGQGNILTKIDTVNINILQYNQQPEISNLGSSTNVYLVTTPAIYLDTNVNIFDQQLDDLNPGVGDYSGSILTISNANALLVSSQDIFSFGTMPNISVTGTNSGTLSYNSDTIANFTNINGTLRISFINSGATIVTQELVNEVAQSIKYSNSNNSPPSLVTLAYQFDDGAGSDNSIVTATINVPIEYHAPVMMDLNNPAVNYTENTTAIPTSAITISNQVTVASDELDLKEDYSGSQVTITRSNLGSLQELSKDIFSFNDITASGIVKVGDVNGTFNILDNGSAGNEIATFDASNSRLVINFINNGTAISKAMVNNIIQAIQYSSSSSNPPAQVTLTYTFNDGLNNINSIIATSDVVINIDPVNDAPINQVPTSAIVSQNNSLTFSSGFGNQISISDPDSQGMVENVTLSVTSGVLKLNITNHDTFTITNNNTKSISLTGTISEINTALDGIVYTPNVNYSGADSLKIETNDQGHTGQGNQLTTTSYVNINVGQLNIPPIINNLGSTSVNTYTEGDTAVYVNSSNQLSIFDAQLNAINPGVGNYNGSSLIVARASDINPQLTAPNAQEDVFSFGNLYGVTTSGNNLVYNSQNIATFSNTNGQLQINFTNSNSVITNAMVNKIIESIVYSNASLDPPISVDLLYRFNDGTNAGIDSIVQATIKVNIIPVDTAPINIVPGSQTIDENTTLVLSASNNKLIAISDVDIGNENATVTLTAIHGSLSLGNPDVVATATGNHTSTITITDNITNINNAISSLIYTPNTNYYGQDTITIKTSDNGNTGVISNGDAQLITTNTINVNIQQVNIAPTINDLGVLSQNNYTEGHNAILINSSNSLSDAQLDAVGNYGGSTLTIMRAGTIDGNPQDVFSFASTTLGFTVDTVNSTLSLDGAVIANFSHVNGKLQINFTSDNGIIVTNTIANTIMQSIQYSNASSNPPASIKLNYSFDDGMNAINSIVTAPISINIIAVDNPPVNSIPATQNSNQNASLTFSLSNGNLISISDVDIQGSNAIVTLSVNNGQLSFNGVSGLTNVTNNAGTITATGNLTNINAALNGLVYKPNPNYHATDTLTITTGDNGNSGTIASGLTQLTTTSTIDINVNTFGVPPSINNLQSASSYTYKEGGSPVFINNSSYFTVSDLQLNLLNNGNGDYTGSKITIVNSDSNSSVDIFSFGAMANVTVVGGNLAVNGQVIANIVNNNTGLQISFVNNGMIATNALVNEVIQAVKYSNSSSAPPASVTLNYAFDNGLGYINSVTSSNIAVNITGVDNPPINQAPLTQVATENTSVVFSSQNNNAIAIQYIDGVGSAGNTTVTLHVDHGSLALSTINGLLVNGNNSSNITLTGNVSNINTALNGLTFTPDHNYYGASNLIFTTNDNGSFGQGGPLTTTSITAITVNQLNIPPVITGSLPVSNNIGIEGGTPVFINNNNQFLISSPQLDVLNDGLGNYGGSSLNISRVGAPDSQDIFSFGATTDFTVNYTNNTLISNGNTIATFSYNNGQLSIEFTSNNGTVVTRDMIATILQSISYSNTSDNPPTSVDLSYVFNDGLNAGTNSIVSSNITININQINDAPINILPQNTQAVNENDNLVFSQNNGNAISIKDLDIGSGNATINLNVTNGDLALNSSATGVVVSSQNKGYITVTGTIANLNNALNGLIYTPDPNFSGNAELTITTNDNGYTGQVGSLSTVSGPLTIVVNPINLSPSNTAASINNLGSVSVNNYIENTSPCYINSSQYFSIADPVLDAFTPSGNYNDAKIIITVAGGGAQNVLGIGDLSSLGINEFNNNLIDINSNIIAILDKSISGQLTITFDSTNGTIVTTELANKIAAAIRYHNTSENPPNNVSISYVFDDGLNLGDASVASANTILNITSINDAPINSLNNLSLSISPVSQYLNQNATLKFYTGNNNKITISDVDTGSNGLETVILQVNNGTLTLGSITGLTNVTGNNSSHITITDTISNINNALNNLIYTPKVNYYGADSLKITTTDPGSLAQGGPLTIDNAININVNQLNVAPVITGFGGTRSTYVEGSSPVLINTNSNFNIFDNQLNAISPGVGNYHGSSLMVVRDGGANIQDVFSFASMVSAGISVNNNNNTLNINGHTIAKFTNYMGQLQIEFISDDSQVVTNDANMEIESETKSSLQSPR